MYCIILHYTYFRHDVYWLYIKTVKQNIKTTQTHLINQLKYKYEEMYKEKNEASNVDIYMA